MNPFSTMLAFTTFAGCCILIGGFAAMIERLRPGWLDQELRHSIIAFGGGVLVSAVALVLVPEGSKLVPSAWIGSLVFLLGGLVFFLLERYLGLRRREKPQFTAMLLDYIPESVALGGMFAVGAASAPLLALLIGLQNLPEGFNAFRELNSLPHVRRGKILFVMCALVPLGPLVGTLGWFHGAEHGLFLGSIMLFSAGGILYLVFQDIAPQSYLERHWGPALGAVLGFGVGFLGQQIIPVA